MTAAEYNSRELKAWRIAQRHLKALVIEAHCTLEDAVAAFQARNGLDPDGKLGPLTRAALDGWSPTVDPIPHGWAETLARYGDPGLRIDPRNKCKYIVDQRWESENLAVVAASLIPGYHRPIYMHRLVKPHFLEAMRRVSIDAPYYTFDDIGCFNPRHIKDDPDLPPSDHALAIAFDLNGRKRNHWAPGYLEPWAAGWSQYSDLPRAVVYAFEGVGFEWGGRWAGSRDTMHFSLRRV